jgi:thiamine-monophosphate kinase
MLAVEPVGPELRSRLERPEPRLALGQGLRGLATAMIDVSDGLAADLGHILDASGFGAELDLARLPLTPAVALAVEENGEWSLPLASGDDYELCFCASPERHPDIQGLADRLGCLVTAVGVVTATRGLYCRRPDGALWRSEQAGYDHFPARD